MVARYTDEDERYVETDPFSRTIDSQTIVNVRQTTQTIADQSISDVVTPPAIASTQNNYSLGEGKKFRLSTSGGAQIITGFANVQPGREIFLYNVGANNITLNNQDAGSSAENRIITGTGAAVVVAPDGSAVLVYDNITLRWRKTPTV